MRGYCKPCRIKYEWTKPIRFTLKQIQCLICSTPLTSEIKQGFTVIRFTDLVLDESVVRGARLERFGDVLQTTRTEISN